MASGEWWTFGPTARSACQSHGVARGTGDQDGFGGWQVAGDGVAQGGEELGVFGGAADGDADGFRETHPGHGTNDDPFVEEFVAKRFGVGAEGDEEEIGLARNRREMELGELEEEPAAFEAIGFDGAADVLGVVERGKRGGLANAGDIEGGTELVHFGYERGMADAVANTESCETVDLGEGPQGEDVVVFAEEIESAGEVAALGVLVIGLVDDDEDIAGNLVHKGGEFFVAEGSAGGVVGIRDVDDAGMRPDRSGDGVEVESVILHRGLDEIAAAGANGDGE